MIKALSALLLLFTVVTTSVYGSGFFSGMGAVGVTDHGALTGLGDDDHGQYPLLLGRSGGQTLIGGTAASNNLTLESTSNVTKGDVNIVSGTDLALLGGDLNFTTLAGDRAINWDHPTLTDFKMQSNQYTGFTQLEITGETSGDGIILGLFGADRDGTEYNSIDIYGLENTEFVNNEVLSIGYDNSGPNTFIATAAAGTGTVRPLNFQFNFGTTVMALEDGTSVTLNSGTLRESTNSTADAAAADSLTIQGGNKTAGTGDGGDVILVGGTSAGGTAGTINLTSETVISDGEGLDFPSAGFNARLFNGNAASFVGEPLIIESGTDGAFLALKADGEIVNKDALITQYHTVDATFTNYDYSLFGAVTFEADHFIWQSDSAGTGVDMGFKIYSTNTSNATLQLDAERTDAGNANLSGGVGTTQDGGDVVITGGDVASGSGDTGGDIFLTAGDVTSGSGNGGTITLAPGDRFSIGNDGIVSITKNLEVLGQSHVAVVANGAVTAASIPTDLDDGNVQTWTLDADCPCTLAAPTNIEAGGRYIWQFTQDGVGSRTLAYNAVFLFPGGTAPTLSTGIGDIDALKCYSPDGTNLHCEFALDYS